MNHCPAHDELACGFDFQSTCAECRPIFFPAPLPYAGDLRENLIRLLGVVPRELSTKEKQAELQRLADLAFTAASDFQFADDLQFANAQLRLSIKLKAELIKEMKSAALAIAQARPDGV